MEGTKERRIIIRGGGSEEIMEVEGEWEGGKSNGRDEGWKIREHKYS